MVHKVAGLVARMIKVFLSRSGSKWIRQYKYILCRLELEVSYVVIIGLIFISHQPSCNFYIRYTYSFISSFYDTHSNLSCTTLHVHVDVTISVDDVLVVDREYKSYVMSILGYFTSKTLLCWTIYLLCDITHGLVVSLLCGLLLLF